MTEILFAIALFSTAIVILLGTLTSSATAIRQGEDRLCAQNIAEGLLESFRSQTFDQIGGINPPTPYIDSKIITYTNSGAIVNRKFDYTVTVTNTVVVSSVATLKDIRVRVTWFADNINHSLSLQTAVTEQ